MTSQREPAQVDWAAALAEHEPWLRRVIAARVGEPQAVGEVLQEVSLVAVRQKAPLEDPEKIAPWLYRLAVTQSLLYRRKMGRKRKLTDRYAQRERPTEADTRHPDPLGWLVGEERRQAVRSAVGKLSDRDAEILMLKYTQDWSYKQIAEHLGLSQSAVEARLHRARQRLRRQLHEMEAIEVS
ncbi:MAG: RNA polymerase sigma factor [Pirellulales bacterium]